MSAVSATPYVPMPGTTSMSSSSDASRRSQVAEVPVSSSPRGIGIGPDQRKPAVRLAAWLGREWTRPQMILLGGAMQGCFIGLCIALLVQILNHLLEAVWVLLPQQICPNPPCQGMALYNVVAVALLWCLAATAEVVLQVPGPAAPGMPVLLGKVHSPGYMLPPNALGAVARIWFVNFLFITGATSIGPEVQCMLTGGIVAAVVSQTCNQSDQNSRILTLAGMGAALACFFGLTVGAAIFVMELPTGGLGGSFTEGWETVTVAAISATYFFSMAQGIEWGGLDPASEVTGLAEARNTNIPIGLIAGLLAAITGTIFLHTTKLAKQGMARFGIIRDHDSARWIFFATMMGVITGLISAFNPYTMFFSEPQLETFFTLGKVPLSQAPSKYSPVLFGWAGIGPQPLAAKNGTWAPGQDQRAAWGTLEVGSLTGTDFFVTAVLKIFNVVVCACLWPGGVIWPLMCVGMCVGAAWSAAWGLSVSTTVLYMMATGAAVEATALKNPLGVSIVMLSQVGTNTPFAVISSLPTIVLACIISWGLTDGLQYFPAAVQRYRQPHPDSVAVHPTSEVAGAGSSNIQIGDAVLRPSRSMMHNTAASVAPDIGSSISTGERVLNRSGVFDVPLAAATAGQRHLSEPALLDFTARGINSSVLDRF